MIRPGAIALVSAELAAIVHVQFTPAMTAAQKPGQRQFAFAGRPASERAGHASRIISDCLEIAFEFFPADVSLVMILDQDVPFLYRPANATANALSAARHADPTCCASEGIGAGVDRIGQDVVHDVVGCQAPHDAVRFSPARFGGQFDPLVSEPDMRLPRALKLGEFLEHEPDGLLHALVRVLLDAVAPHFT